MTIESNCWHCGQAIHPLDTTHAFWCRLTPMNTKREMGWTETQLAQLRRLFRLELK